MSAPQPPNHEEFLYLMEAVAEGTVTALGAYGLPPFVVEHEGEVIVLVDDYGYVPTNQLPPDHPTPGDDAA